MSVPESDHAWFNATSLSDRTTHRRAIELAIWGVGASSYDKQMVVNPDGSVDVHIGRTAPEDMAGYWIPTAGKDFWLIARFYGPEKTLFDKQWTMPDVEKVS